MFYELKIEDHIRIPPEQLEKPVEEAITAMVKEKYEGFISSELGIVIDISNVENFEEGILIPGDGAVYRRTVFNLITFQPELHEVLYGRVKDIADFGVFMNIGPIEGMIHISQSMDDFVSFSKDKTLLGRDTKRSLRVGDNCKARVIAVSFKDLSNPKIGLTMRQGYLGKIEWIDEDATKKEGKSSASGSKSKKE